jgi:hypothetical protein
MELLSEWKYEYYAEIMVTHRQGAARGGCKQY